MLQLLSSFAALTLLSGLMLTLLPEGLLRRTASMVVGLLMLMLWADGLQELLNLPEAPDVPDTVLVSTGVGVQ